MNNTKTDNISNNTNKNNNNNTITKEKFINQKLKKYLLEKELSYYDVDSDGDSKWYYDIDSDLWSY